MLTRRGFTLIELLVVILIIGILLALIIPNFVLFQERARRTSVKNNMHVVQTALEAWAVDHFGTYPSSDVSWDVGDETGISVYFPGGDVYGASSSPLPGNFPTNPYSGIRYNINDYDLNYEDQYGAFDPGTAAQTSGSDDACPYLDWEDGCNGLQGAIVIGTYNDENTDIPIEYGMAGWGRNAASYPMYDVSPGGDPTDDTYWVFFVLHN